LKKLRKGFQDKLAEGGTVAEESISSMRTVRMFSAEPKASHSYGVEIDASYKLGKKLAMLIGKTIYCNIYFLDLSYNGETK